jgi:hypothetical protein
MIGDLYEHAHFNGAESALSCMQEFVEGYGGFGDELAFRTAIHAGTQLIGGYNRRPKKGPVTVLDENMAGMLTTARDFVLKGWERDRDWFEGSVLACLFPKKRVGEIRSQVPA